MKTLVVIAVLGVITLAGGVSFLYSGLYPMGADVPHNQLTYWVLETLRERSVARASADLKVPNLADPDLLLAGGADYDAMCTGCHLKPGKSMSDMSIGLYPAPPNLTKAEDEHGHIHGSSTEATRRQFWIIKHGIKASGMPAWGVTHDDQRIWAMVAFLQKLPGLTPEQYQILTASSTAESSHH